jgi:hypothetical protein
MGSVPEVYIKGPEDGGVCVVCITSGWYPEPQVHWKDSRGEKLTASLEIHSEDAQGLFRTETSLVVRDSSVRNVTCSTFNPILGQEKAMAMFLPGECCPSLLQSPGCGGFPGVCWTVSPQVHPLLSLCLGDRALLSQGLSLEASIFCDPDHDGTSSLRDKLSFQKGTFCKADRAGANGESSTCGG